MQLDDYYYCNKLVIAKYNEVHNTKKTKIMRYLFPEKGNRKDFKNYINIVVKNGLNQEPEQLNITIDNQYTQLHEH